MNVSWKTETGHLLCHWRDLGAWTPYEQNWMTECGNLGGSYLPPLPDFSSHSPFGGPSWFEPSSAPNFPTL